MSYTIDQIARVCHEANRGLCEADGDPTQVEWDEAAPWQRESAISGIQFALAHPDAVHICERITMITLKATCDNCGAVREEPISMLSGTKPLELNQHKLADQWNDITNDGWHAVHSKTAIYCPACKTATRLAEEARERRGDHA